MSTIEKLILRAVAHVLRIVADAIDVELNPDGLSAPDQPPQQPTDSTTSS